MFELGLKSLLSYLLGSLVGALLVGRLQGGVDIRTVGSGNPGGTNALRMRGKAFAFWVMLIDVGKGVAAVMLVPALDVPWFADEPPVARDWLTIACASAAIAGHVYPVWFQFRGGKGAATFLGTLLGMHPQLLVPVLATWLIVVMLSGYVGLGTIFSGLALPAYVYWAYSPVPAALMTFGVCVALFLMVTHRGNIARMLRGEEHRAQKLWLLRR